MAWCQRLSSENGLMEALVDPSPPPLRQVYPEEMKLSAFEHALFSTIAYRDFFDFAPAIDEIHRYLHFIRCNRQDVLAALQNGTRLSRHLVTDGTYFALSGRAELLAMRHQRQALFERYWPLAVRYGSYFANFPHIRMVALTGSFAARNVRDDCDIDFMMITDAGAMWRTRALGILSALVHQRFAPKKICPNYFISMAALVLERKSFYDAQELVQMIPLFGSDVYDRLRQANRWTDMYLPNATGAPEGSRDSRPPLPRLKRIVEWGSNSPIGRTLENFEARRKIRLFNETDHLKGVWTKSTRETHSLRDYIRQDIESAWRRRVEALDSAEPKN